MSEILNLQRRWLKAELHAHCNLDPVDHKVCRYSPEQLISEAAKLGYEVLAITCHDLDIWTKDLSDYAESLGLGARRHKGNEDEQTSGNGEGFLKKGGETPRNLETIF